MTQNLIRTDWDVIDAAIIAGDEFLGRLAGRRENLRGGEYDELFILVESIPIGMKYQDHRWIEARLVNAKGAKDVGEAAFEIRQLVRRLRHKHAVTAREGS